MHLFRFLVIYRRHRLTGKLHYNPTKYQSIKQFCKLLRNNKRLRIANILTAFTYLESVLFDDKQC